MHAGGSGGANGDYNTAAYNIARWDGSRWFALGSGILDTVNVIVVSGSNVYVGGRFNTAGGVTVNNIARWDGQNWWPLGAGTDQPVLALAVDGNGRLYAGGAFRNAGGVAVDGLARWNGTAWEKLPSNNPFCPNHNCGVSALTFDRSGNLYPPAVSKSAVPGARSRNGMGSPLWRRVVRLWASLSPWQSGQTADCARAEMARTMRPRVLPAGTGAVGLGQG